MKKLKTTKAVCLCVVITTIFASCTNIYEDIHNWDSFREMASSNGATFFSEATAPNGMAAFGGSKHNQAGANSTALSLCKKFSGELCAITRTDSSPDKR